MIRAYISEHFPGFSGINVLIVDHREGAAPLVMRPMPGGIFAWEPHPDDQADAPAPTLTLPADCGRTLLDALTRHYDGAEDTRTLRRDYEREIARVDRQAALIEDVVRHLVPAPGGRP